MGFRAPETPLVLGFLLLPIYRSYDSFFLDFWQLGMIAFLLYPLYAWIKKDRIVLAMSFLFVLTVLVVGH